MEWLDKIKTFVIGSVEKKTLLNLPLGISVLQFCASVFDAAKDGSISAQEWHHLAVSLSGGESLLLGLIIFFIKKMD